MKWYLVGGPMLFLLLFVTFVTWDAGNEKYVYAGGWQLSAVEGAPSIEIYSVAVAAGGYVYIADGYTHTVTAHSGRGRFLGRTVIPAPVPELDTWDLGWWPGGLTVGPRGLVYVADNGNRRILCYTADLSFLREWGPSELEFFRKYKYSLTALYDVGVAANGVIYITALSTPAVNYFTSGGYYAGVWGPVVSMENQNSPPAIALGLNGDVYVADGFGCAVRCFTFNGLLKHEWGSRGTGDGEFNFPADVAVGPDGTVFIADKYNHRIQYFTPNGSYVGQFKLLGTASGEPPYPVSVDVSASGVVYAVDGTGPYVQYFRPTQKPDTVCRPVFTRRDFNRSKPPTVDVPCP